MDVTFSLWRDVGVSVLDGFSPAVKSGIGITGEMGSGVGVEWEWSEWSGSGSGNAGV